MWMLQECEEFAWMVSDCEEIVVGLLTKDGGGWF